MVVKLSGKALTASALAHSTCRSMLELSFDSYWLDKADDSARNEADLKCFERKRSAEGFEQASLGRKTEAGNVWMSRNCLR